MNSGAASVAAGPLSGAGRDRYWRRVVAALRAHFRVDAAAIDAALASVSCADLRRVAWKRPNGPFYDEASGEGHPVLYEPLPPDDPLRTRCAA